MHNRIANDDILNSEKKKQESDFGHNENEWGLADKSEDIEWDEHYHDRNKKWRFKDEPEGGEF